MNHRLPRQLPRTLPLVWHDGAIADATMPPTAAVGSVRIARVERPDTGGAYDPDAV